jgi:hypothetical protein
MADVIGALALFFLLLGVWERAKRRAIREDELSRLPQGLRPSPDLHYNPPSDLHDRSAWDDYWMHHLHARAEEQVLANLMASDESLPDLFRRRGARTILCAGNGLSFEAVELALLGFDVTGLDLSSAPDAVWGAKLRDPAYAAAGIPGFRVRDDGSVTFGAPGRIEPDQFRLPRLHRPPDQPFEGGGSLAFVTGDLTDPDVCPGPFDVVIERRTVQLFEGAAQIEALERLVARLGDRAILVSQQHSGGWRPHEPRTHFAKAWLRARGFVLRSAASPGKTETSHRLAILEFTSG